MMTWITIALVLTYVGYLLCGDPSVVLIRNASIVVNLTLSTVTQNHYIRPSGRSFFSLTCARHLLLLIYLACCQKGFNRPKPRTEKNLRLSGIENTSLLKPANQAAHDWHPNHFLGATLEVFLIGKNALRHSPELG